MPGAALFGGSRCLSISSNSFAGPHYAQQALCGREGRLQLAPLWGACGREHGPPHGVTNPNQLNSEHAVGLRMCVHTHTESSTACHAPCKAHGKATNTYTHRESKKDCNSRSEAPILMGKHRLGGR